MRNYIIKPSTLPIIDARVTNIWEIKKEIG